MKIRHLLKAPEQPKRRGRPPKKPPTLRARFAAHFASFKSPYVLFSAAVLLVTSVWWSVLGALTHKSNADQIIDSYLFQGPETFRLAAFPAAHTFLIKWPLFVIERLSSYSPTVLVILTVLVSVVTVAGLAYILYRIDKRPRVIGTAFLVLACILLFIPAQPHGGGLLPVNFAMLTTRNIEYLFYILSLVFIIRTTHLRSWQTYLAIVVLSLLISSDKLFMWISLGGASLMFVVYGIARRTVLVKLALRWFGITVASIIISTVLLWAFNATGLTNIVGDNSPYGISLAAKQLVMGSIFVISALLTNFGANPAFDVGIIKDIPRSYIERLFSPIILPIFINVSIFIAGLVAAITVFRKSLKQVRQSKRKKKQPELSVASLLSLSLIASSIVAIGFFVGTSHYYPVDSRYVTIILFALCICIMAEVRTRPLPNLRMKRITGILLVAIAIGSVWAFATYKQQSDALSTIDVRNAKIAEVVENHKTDLLLGDYWRVTAISQLDTKLINNIIPLGDCTTPRVTLKSSVWERDFEKRSFTYLLSFDKSLTDYPTCSIDQVIQAYGRPNASSLISGTTENPTELLLFYDGGINKNHSTTGLSKTATILPTTTDEAKRASDCADGVTVMNVVAHEDDDLLFMNPDLQHEIDAKHCIRTIYVTAGDAGSGSQYWLSRERASEAAYASMLGISEPLIWVQRTVKLSDNQFVTVASPRGHKEVSLVYMHLPDGNLKGQGYKVSGFESLERLHSGQVAEIQTVDGQSRYSSGSFSKALTNLMDFYSPTVINTQASEDMGHQFNDHADHIAVGRYVDSAYVNYMNKEATPLYHYIGYPIREFPQNIFGVDLNRKTNTFLTYATFDGSVCQTQAICDTTPTYNAYLHRQYSR